MDLISRLVSPLTVRTPEQQVAYERMLLDKFEVDPQYFIDKYNIPLLKPKKDTAPVAVPDVKKTPQQKSGKEEQQLAFPEGERPFFD